MNDTPPRHHPLRRAFMVIAVVIAIPLGIGIGWRIAHDRTQTPPPAVGEVHASEFESDARVEVGNIDRERMTAGIERDDVPGGQPAPVDSAMELPLPPAGSPVAEWHDDLVARATAGDSRAACRLGAELQRCATRRMTAKTADDMQGDMARRRAVPDQAIDRIARIQQFSEGFGDGCDGLTDEQLDHAFDWQLQAAMRRPELRVWAAVNPALDRQHFLADLDRWSRYRDVALPWLEEAARAGDPTAIIVLARVFGDHRRTSPPFPPFRIADDERSLVYMDLMQRYGIHIPVVQRVAATTRSGLPPDALRRVDAEVDALHRTDLAPFDEAAARQALDHSFAHIVPPEQCE